MTTDKRLVDRKKDIRVMPMFHKTCVLSLLIVSALLFIFLLISWVTRVFSGNYMGSYLDGILFAVGMISVFLLAIFLYKSEFVLSHKRFRVAAGAAVLLAIIAHVLIAHSLLSSGYTWDVAEIYKIARYYIESGIMNASPSAWPTGYLATYGNNMPITLLLILWFKLATTLGGSDFVLYSQILNSTAIIGAFLLTLFSAYKLYGRKGFVVAWGIGFVLLVITPYAPITYTDTLGAFAISIIVALGVLLADKSNRRRPLTAFLFGLFLVGGYLAKPTVLILIISMAILFFIYNYRNPSNLKLTRERWPVVVAMALGIVMCIVVYVSASLLAPNIMRYSEQQIDRRKLPIEHFLGMGSLRGLSPWEGCKSGGYCADYVDWVRSDDGIATLEERKEYGLWLWRKSVSDDFPVGYLSFVLKKLGKSYTDGSFGVWGEGSNGNIHFYNNTDTDKTMREFFGPFGTHRTAVGFIRDGVWFSVLCIIALGCVVGLRYRRLGYNFWLNVFRLALIGLSLYIMIFEARARYLFLYLPVFILLTVGTLAYLARVVKDKHKQIP